MFCKNCNNKINNEDIFCDRRGINLLQDYKTSEENLTKNTRISLK